MPTRLPYSLEPWRDGTNLLKLNPEGFEVGEGWGDLAAMFGDKFNPPSNCLKLAFFECKVKPKEDGPIVTIWCWAILVVQRTPSCITLILREAIKTIVVLSCFSCIDLRDASCISYFESRELCCFQLY